MRTVTIFGRELRPGEYRRVAANGRRGRAHLVIPAEGEPWYVDSEDRKHRPTKDQVEHIFDDRHPDTTVERVDLPPAVAASALDDMLVTFVNAGMAAPPVPASMRERLVTIHQWCWATKPISAMSMYFFREPDKVSDDPADDYVAVSHAGHGANSYTINYHLVYRNLALFTQVPWGGVYTDRREATTAVAELFAYCRTLIDIVDATAGRSPSPWRFVLRSSAIRSGATGAGWIRVPEGGADIAQLPEPPQEHHFSIFSTAAKMLAAGPPAD